VSHQVVVRDVQIAYPNRNGSQFVALDQVDLDVDQGEFVTIVGPSGCGKSTLLLALDGLLKPVRGEVLVGGKPVTGPGPDRAMVFQEFALLPWRNVLGNVKFGMELNGRKGKAATARALELINLVGLRGFEQHHPHQLSGGMRQRVGIARALAVDPDVLLMDEPFGALDAQTREIMGGELLKVWEQDRKTVLFVTHGIDEAIYLADRVVVISKGPGRVLETLDVDLPRPRTMDVRKSPEYVALRDRISHLLFDQADAERRVEGAVA
jgi:NitT/TauT family transport system ATP-binding protein